MSSSMRFSGYFDFYFTTQTQGGDIIQYFYNIDNSVKNTTTNITKMSQSATQSGTSMRRLALDIRLVSSSVRQMVTATGLQDTALGRVSDVVTIVSGTLVGLISTSNAYVRVADLVAKQGGLQAAAFALATKAVAGFKMVLASTLGAVILPLIAGFIAFNAVFAETSGINQYRDSIKGLEEDVEDLEDSINDLSLAQSGLGVQSAALAAQQAYLDAQFRQGLMTEGEYTKQTNLLEVSKANLGAQSAELAFQERFYQHEVNQNKSSIDDYGKAIEDTYEARNKMLEDILRGRAPAGGILETVGHGFFTGITSPNAWGALLRGMLGYQGGGVVTQTGPIFAHAGEQVIPAGGGGTGSVSLTISLDGANIYGSEGIEEALQAAGSNLQKQLEYMRRPRTRW